MAHSQDFMSEGPIAFFSASVVYLYIHIYNSYSILAEK